MVNDAQADKERRAPTPTEQIQHEPHADNPNQGVQENEDVW